MIGGGLTIAKALFKSLPYDIETDIVPISTTASYGLLIATKAGSPYKTIKDVIAAAKVRPGELNFGTINAGSTQNLSAELFRIRSGINVTIVPYKTTPDLAYAVLRGDVDVAFEYFAGFQAPIKNGQMTVLATTGRERAGNLPDVPTAAESGVPDYEVTSWNGLGIRKGAPAAIVAAQSRRRRSAEVTADSEFLQRRWHGRARHDARRFTEGHHKRRCQMVAGDRQGGDKKAVIEADGDFGGTGPAVPKLHDNAETPIRGATPQYRAFTEWNTLADDGLSLVRRPCNDGPEYAL